MKVRFILGVVALLAQLAHGEELERYYLPIKVQVQREGISDSYARGLAENMRSVVEAYFQELPGLQVDMLNQFGDDSALNLEPGGRRPALEMDVAVLRDGDVVEVSVRLSDIEGDRELLTFHYEGSFFSPTEARNAFVRRLEEAAGKPAPAGLLEAPSPEGFNIRVLRELGLHLEQIPYQQGLLLNYPDLHFDLNSTSNLPVGLSRRLHGFRLFRGASALVFWAGAVVNLGIIPVGYICSTHNADGRFNQALQYVGYTYTVGLCAAAAGFTGILLSTPVCLVRDMNSWLRER
jgi:hypothetical protein